MKTAMIVVLFAVLAIWIGYDQGHRQGMQAERRLWESTAQRNQSAFTLDHDTSHLPPAILYRNPHLGMIPVSSRGTVSMNLPSIQ